MERARSCASCANKPKRVAPGQILLSRIRYDAESRGFKVTVSLKHLRSVYDAQAGKCAYTGLPLTWPDTHAQRRAPDLSPDRIDSSKGYVPGNVQWVHKRINMMKQALPEEEFMEWCRLVTTHRNPAAFHES